MYIVRSAMYKGRPIASTSFYKAEKPVRNDLTGVSSSDCRAWSTTRRVMLMPHRRTRTIAEVVRLQIIPLYCRHHEEMKKAPPDSANVPLDVQALIRLFNYRWNLEQRSTS